MGFHWHAGDGRHRCKLPTDLPWSKALAFPAQHLNVVRSICHCPVYIFRSAEALLSGRGSGAPLFFISDVLFPGQHVL